MNYEVVYADDVTEEIGDRIRYLQRQRVSRQKIDDWVGRLFDAIDSLAEWPLRYPIAEVETAAFGVELRKMNFGEYLVFYQVDSERRVVNVFAFRHGARRPLE